MSIQKEDSHRSEKRHFNAGKLAELVYAVVDGVTHNAFCEAHNIGRTTLSSILNGNLDAPPSISTLIKIADSDEALLNELLLTCGYSIEDWKRAKKNTERRRVSQKLVMPRVESTAAQCLLLVLGILCRMGKADDFTWKYPTGEQFILKNSRYEVIGFPALCTELSECEEVHRKTTRELLKTLFRLSQFQSKEDLQKVIIVVTNCLEVYEKLVTSLSLLPDQPCRISMILSVDGVTVAKQEEVKIDGEGFSMNNESSFPFWLKN